MHQSFFIEQIFTTFTCIVYVIEVISTNVDMYVYSLLDPPSLSFSLFISLHVGGRMCAGCAQVRLARAARSVGP